MRLFLATTFPDGVLREIDQRVVRAKSRLPAASWVRLETQHLTLAFLGEQKEALLQELDRNLPDALREVHPFDASVRGSGFFPNPRHARVGWMGLDPAEPFRALADVVREAVKRSGVTLDDADFKPHLTLCRIRDRWPPASIETFQKAFGDYESPPFTVGEVILFSSDLKPTGAVHTALRKFALT